MKLPGHPVLLALESRRVESRRPGSAPSIEPNPPASGIVSAARPSPPPLEASRAPARPWTFERHHLAAVSSAFLAVVVIVAYIHYA